LYTIYEIKEQALVYCLLFRRWLRQNIVVY